MRDIDEVGALAGRESRRAIASETSVPSFEDIRRGHWTLLPSPRWRAASAIAAFVAVAVTVALIAPWSGSHGPSVVSVPRGPSPAAAVAGFERLDRSATGFGSNASIYTAAFHAGSFVVGGSTGLAGAPTNERSAVWISGDGRSFQAISGLGPSGGATRVIALATQPDALFALVSTPQGVVAWRSADGRQWAPLTDTLGAVPDQTGLNGLVVTGGRLVTFGSTASGGAVWTAPLNSPTWHEARLPGGVVDLSASRGTLVALVDLPIAPGAREVVVYTSPDGTVWTQGQTLGTSQDPGGETLAVVSGDFWAATAPAGNASVLWHSSDGVNWGQDLPTPSAALVDRIGAVGTSLVAAGTSGDVPNSWIYTTDGWIGLPSTLKARGGRFNVLATSDQALVAFGTAPELSTFVHWRAP